MATLNGATAVVTGGTRGVGHAVAETFLESGAAVVLGDRDADALDDAVAALDGDATGVRADVRDEFDVERLAETASRFGPVSGIDLVIPAAATYHGDPGTTPTDRESYAAFDDNWRTNARGVFTTIRESLPHLTDGARVLVPTTPVAREGRAGYGSYAVSKAAAEAVARGFAADTTHVVAALDVGRVSTEVADGDGREPETVAPMFRWAATEADPAEIDGDVVSFEAWNRTGG